MLFNVAKSFVFWHAALFKVKPRLVLERFVFASLERVIFIILDITVVCLSDSVATLCSF